MGEALARRAADGLLKPLGDWNGQKGAYRLLDNGAASHEGLSSAHWQATRQQAGQGGSVALMGQAITALDDSAHRLTEGLGSSGHHRGPGLLLHHPLAIAPQAKAVMG